MSVVVLVFTTVVAASPAARGPSPRYDLVSHRRCLAGGAWGTPHLEWRIQLGVFAHHGDPAVLQQRLSTRALPLEIYVAAWLDPDREPLVAVTASFRDRATAEAQARRLRARGLTALVRRFTRWY